MGILLPNDIAWSPANWVGRGLFSDLVEHGGLPPALLAKTQFCVDAQLDTMDLRGADDATLRALRDALTSVISTTEQRGPAAFQQPEFQPGYLDKLRLLAAQLDRLLTPPVATAAVEPDPSTGGLGGETDDFPVGETLDEGAYRITATLFGSGLDRVHVAVGRDGATRFLVSSTLRRVPSPGELRRELSYTVPGVFELEFVGGLDQHASGGGAQSDITAIVERLPPGSSLRKLVTGRLPAAAAVQLAISTASIVLGATRAGQLLVAIRPETIWGERELDVVRVTGLSDRGERLFRAAEGVCFTTAPTYERRYTAPEIIKGQPASDRTLTFVMTILLAEWLTGAHPFPDAWTLRDPVSIAMGRHAPLRVPAAIDPLLTRSLRVDPGDRPSLAEWIAELEAMANLEQQ